MKYNKNGHYKIERYRKEKFTKFITHYDVFMISYQEQVRVNNIIKGLPEEEPKEVEKKTILELYEYVHRRMILLISYFEHCLEIGKEIDLRWKKKERPDHLLLNFLAKKYNAISETEIILQPYKKKPKEKSLLNGKNLNLLDRFNLANKLLELEKNVRKLNIGDLEKYDLVSYILGCDKDNARNLMNGRYKAKPNDLSDLYKKIGLPE